MDNPDDPYDTESPEYRKFVEICSATFRSNGWVHVPAYLDMIEVEELLKEAEKYLNSVIICWERSIGGLS
jgi:hypothetical protein